MAIKVVYDKMVFDRRRHELKKENETLQCQVKQVIDGTTISDATMNRHDNLLLTIKGNIMNNRTPNQQVSMSIKLGKNVKCSPVEQEEDRAKSDLST